MSPSRKLSMNAHLLICLQKNLVDMTEFEMMTQFIEMCASIGKSLACS